MEHTKNIDISDPDHKYFNNYITSETDCITCGICSSACPVAGTDRFDPRKLIRIVSLGQKKDAVESRWPWICTMCGKCEELCPMQIPIPSIVRTIRGIREREKVPGILHKGLTAALKTGNNLGLPQEDFEFILQDVGEELAEEEGYAGFEASIDKKGANLMMTVHNKLVNTHTEDLKHLWKIFHAAKEDWTIPAENWEGTNWGLFTGDDDSMKKMTGRIIENMHRLDIKNLLWPEWGHAYIATRSGLEKWYPKELAKINTYTIFDILLKYIKEKRVKLDKRKNSTPAVYHDPCNYGRKSEKMFGYGYYEEPRIILDHCCENWIDTYPTKNHQFCCGGGGGTMVTGYDKERIYYGRKKIEQIKASRARMIIVPCHSCHGQINSIKKEYDMEDLEVKYLWEVFADALILD